MLTGEWRRFYVVEHTIRGLSRWRRDHVRYISTRDRARRNSGPDPVMFLAFIAPPP
jgi:hypothetical protein